MTSYDPNVPLVCTWGMGVDSTALLVGLKNRGIRPDIIIAADTKGEKRETYEYIPTFRHWLENVGFPDLIIVSRDWGKDVSLEAQCLRLGVLPSISYGWKTCSLKWKKEPQDRYLRSQLRLQAFWSEGRKVLKTIAYDLTERHRAEGKNGDDEYILWFPLIEWGWDRYECIRQIEIEGLPVPCKSACFFCGSSKQDEIVQLQLSDADQLGRALEMERRALDPLVGEGTFITDPNRTKGLGRRFNWGELLAGKICSIEPDDSPCDCMD